MIDQTEYDSARVEYREGGQKPNSSECYQIKYRILNDTAYHYGTPLVLVNVLEQLRKNERKVRIMTGYTAHYWHLTEDVRARVGEVWLEESDVVGRIGRSGGRIKVPLLISDDDAGGPALGDDIILRVSNVDNVVLYEDPLLRWPQLTIEANEHHYQGPGYEVIYQYRVTHKGEEQAKFRTKKGAEAYVKFFSPECSIRPSTVKEPHSVMEIATNLLDEFEEDVGQLRYQGGLLETKLLETLHDLRVAIRHQRWQKA